MPMPSAWASWIQANASGLGCSPLNCRKLSFCFSWVLDHDAAYDNGNGSGLYGRVGNRNYPPSLGGQPDVAKAHFDKAIEVSAGKHLMAKVLYAQQYARLMFEQELHDQLLQEVMAADPKAEGLTLINQLAKQQAAPLLVESAEYFE